MRSRPRGTVILLAFCKTRQNKRKKFIETSEVWFPTEMQKLPSRDIPRETIHYQQDAAIQANYIPPPDPKKRVVDYIHEYDENESAKIRKNSKNKQKHEWYESLFRTYQTPIIIALLYFIFQMNIVSSFLLYSFPICFSISYILPVNDCIFLFFKTFV